NFTERAVATAGCGARLILVADLCSVPATALNLKSVVIVLHACSSVDQSAIIMLKEKFCAQTCIRWLRNGRGMATGIEVKNGEVVSPKTTTAGLSCHRRDAGSMGGMRRSSAIFSHRCVDIFARRWAGLGTRFIARFAKLFRTDYTAIT